MSSTKDTLQAGVRRLADPLYDALTTAGGARPPFPLQPDAALSSYYTQRTQTTMRPADFLGPSCLDAAAFGRQLAIHWQAAGQPQLAQLAPRIAATAHALHALHVASRPQAEVSPLVYQMF